MRMAATGENSAEIQINFNALLSWSYVKDTHYIYTLNMRLVTKKLKQRQGMEETFYKTTSNCETVDRN